MVHSIRDGRTTDRFDLIEISGFNTAPPVSPLGRSELYYNKVTKELMLSKDGGAWTALGGGGVSLDQTTPQEILNGYPINASEPSFTYSSGVLTRVDYPSGFYKTLAYNGDGTLNNITYSNGTVKTMNWSGGLLQSIGVA